ncbi:amonabactin biosynthesis (2,3-dihydroxybenzoyl)adenylate synthase AmoE [Aeromonas media]|uniref:amonabactin biosynthesis (2,3-dihydroxybenzoyl)adenylate synthase AmoE n=1 Tax=Aeromonas media TaxID=651 RepID=UPI0002861E80|nr:amonabactin biosynthesis (2,3-dihydroxybenzoyl)adenylate synthase AmoE [Aeromonas media]AHX60451.1 enterobactin synthase subunit E [Aeromonas media WS]MBP8281346.1 (2,3-dihydroxybenzoyl)adenylate synthase [Aeromonas sp.]QQQ15224.1 (2,3-dihydroxybenzoyl)adenylate synthase [Aeromonas media]
MTQSNRFLPYTRWPDALAERYRAKGYWRGEPLTAMLARQRELAPYAEAILCGERRFSYRELDAASSRLAANLARHGLGIGDTALVQLPNVAEFYLVFFALLKAGIAPVNALFSHNRLELLSYAEQIAPRLFIGSLAHPLFANKGCESELLIAIGAGLVLLDGDGGELGLTHWLTKVAESEPMKCGPTPADEVAFFQLSGGSTGTPKLIPRTHDDYLYSVRRSVELCGLGPHTRYLCALPAPHNFPLSSPGALGVFEAGGTVVLAPDPGPISCFPLIARHRVNLTSLVPPAVSLWLQAAEADPTARAQLESLDLLQVGGAKLGEAVASKIGPLLGCRLQQVFGMAEGLVNYTRLDDPDEKVIHTQGRPMSPDDEVRILDEAGNPVAPGEPGALHTRGPYTFCGYYQSPAHNARVFDAEGFYCSGDLVVQDADGYLTVVGRQKDQINRGGEKIAAEEVENQLLHHPAITHAALVSMPDSAMGEKSCAFIVSTDPALKPLALRKFLRERGVADFKLPDRFETLDALPMTAVGKIDKQGLRARIAHAIAANQPLTTA